MKSSFAQIHKDLAELLPGALHARCQTVTYKKGDTLFVVGDKPQAMFFVASGEVVLQRIGLQGEPIVLQRASQCFVAEASLQSASYHCDARVVARANITRVAIADIQSAMVADPVFAQRWISMQSRELKRLRLQCERLSLNRVEDRLLHLIETEGNQGYLPVSAGLKSLAGQLGVTHEALYRCVASLEKAQRLQRVLQGVLLTGTA
jgi:CRP/FNR family transcriptional regulator, dissimilatory nitrate respiration regulator